MTYSLDYVLALAEERDLTKYITSLGQDLGVQLLERSVQPIRIARAEHAFTICRREGHEIAFALMVRCLHNMLNLK